MHLQIFLYVNSHPKVLQLRGIKPRNSKNQLWLLVFFHTKHTSGPIYWSSYLTLAPNKGLRSVRKLLSAV